MHIENIHIAENNNNIIIINIVERKLKFYERSSF